VTGALDGATGAALRAEARRILRLELGTTTDLTYVGDPLVAACGLLNTAPAEWPKPGGYLDGRQAKCVAAVARTILRLQAERVPQGRAEAAVAIAWAQILGGATK
jgi:hypothetical protein